MESTQGPNMAPLRITRKLIKICESSRPEVLCKKSVLRNFTKFPGKHLCQSLFLNKKETLAQVFSYEFCEISKNIFFFTEHLAHMKVCKFIKKRLQHRRCPVNIAKFLRPAFFTEHLQWLRLVL